MKGPMWTSAGHLVTPLLDSGQSGQDRKIYYYIKNCSPDGSAALFAVKQTFPISLHYQPYGAVLGTPVILSFRKICLA